MEGGAAAATIEVLVQNLINVARDEISLTRNLDKDAQKLKTSLAMIQSYLNDANKILIDQDAVKTWLNELEDVAFDADNVLDELNYHHLCKKVKKLMSLKHKVLSFFSSFDRISRPSKMAHKIKEINTNLEFINNRATGLGLESKVVNAPAAAAAAAAAFETNSFTLDPIFIGRDDDLPKLIDALTDKSKEREFSILAIVGMGGMGKTTLTRKVFNHQRIKAQFGSIVWVHVSQTFDAMILFKKILASLKMDENLQKSLKANEVESREVALKKLQEVESMEDVLKNLQEALKAKTCLLVLDDVWNEDLHKWKDFINSLSGVTSIKGNGIIVTTRNTGVASTVNPVRIHQLNPLSHEECWSIIKAKTFENGEVPSEFEITGRKIAERCQGLPLAANVVGGVLRNKSEDEWHSVQQKWLSDDENTILKILRLSFDNLSSPSLKKCFAYCSIFPKGHRIVKQELIELWMAEGFLQPDHRNDMESMGNKFLNVLLHNSLLLVAPNIYRRPEEYCLMHDLVHDLACSVLGSSKLDDNINSDGISRVRYASHEHDKEESSPIPKQVAKYLRTFSFKGEISGTMFSDFKSLHALTLGRGCKELPSSIKKLIHLRSLNISTTWIESLPEWIGALHHLQTLRADTCSLGKLPSTLKYLINLRHLYIDNDVEFPAEIGKLTSLQTLRHFTVGDKKGYKIEELGNLKNLKGELVIRNLEKVHDKDEAVKANIFQKPNLSSLQFSWESREGDERNDESVLEGLQPHPNLKKLTIHRFKGKKFPLWTMKMAVRDEPHGSWIGLNKLTEITLSYCRECEEIPAFGHLPNLKSLYLSQLSNVTSINSSFYGNGACKETTIIIFPALERLTLRHMPKLREWREVEFPNETRPNCQVKLFPQLQYLQIFNCSSIPLANIFEIKLTSFKNISIRGFDELECLPDWLFYNNLNLSELRISKCPKLRELPDGLHTLNSQEELSIRDCQNLKKIGRGQSQGNLTSLHRLDIIGCPELMDFPCEIVESLAPSLKTLSLVGLRSLKTLPKLLDSLTKPTANSSSEILTFCSLQTLSLDVNMEWLRESSVAIKQTVDVILQGCCNSLTFLRLEGMEVWDSLPESIQHLTALHTFYLGNIGVEELPEWFGNLSSLMVLNLYKYNNLRRLPSMDAMQRLTNLLFFNIIDCSNELVIPKCFDIPHLSINVDGRLIDHRSTCKYISLIFSFNIRLISYFTPAFKKIFSSLINNNLIFDLLNLSPIF